MLLLKYRQCKCSPGRFRSLPKGTQGLRVYVVCAGRTPEQSSGAQGRQPSPRASWDKPAIQLRVWLLMDRQLVWQSGKGQEWLSSQSPVRGRDKCPDVRHLVQRPPAWGRSGVVIRLKKKKKNLRLDDLGPSLSSEQGSETVSTLSLRV